MASPQNPSAPEARASSGPSGPVWPIVVGLLALAAGASFLSLSGCKPAPASPALPEAVAKAAAPSPAPSPEAKAAPTPPAAAVPGVAGDPKRFERLAGLPVEQAFAEVARLRNEPYAGVLRGPQGTARSGGGNSLDKALLLAHVLREQGMEVRIARGTLKGERLATAVRAIYPAAQAPKAALAPELQPYEPTSDKALTRLVQRHYWVELSKGEDQWTALDTWFPGAKPGEGFTEAEETFDTPEDEQFQTVRIALKQRTAGDGEPEELGVAEGKVAELASQPLALVIRASPAAASAAGASASGGGEPGDASPAGLFGAALGGEEEAKPAPKPKARAKASAPSGPPKSLTFQPVFYVGDDVQEARATTSTIGEPDSLIRREWLEITLTEPGSEPRIIERTLFESSREQPLPAHHRVYSLTLVPGAVSQAEVRAEVAQGPSKRSLDAWRKQLDAARGGKAPSAEELAELEKGLSRHSGRLLALAFAAESDQLTERLATASGVTVVRASPRVLITTVEATENAGRVDTRVSFDLRLDEVRAYPAPGHATQAARLFQRSRGMQESFLEGAVLSRYVPKEVAPVSTAAVMNAALAEGIALMAIDKPADLGALKGLSEPVRRLLTRTLQAGRRAIVPASPVQLAGRARLGWWDVDPSSGAIIGVMESGEHQGMAEYTVTQEQVGFNDDVGFILGAIVGAQSMLFIISAKMLEYGALTPELLKEAAAWLEGNACVMCPKAEAKAGAELKYGGDCLKLEANVGMKTGLSFCERYQDGFKCTAGMLLASLRGEVAKVEVEGTLWDVNAACAQNKSGGN